MAERLNLEVNGRTQALDIQSDTPLPPRSRIKRRAHVRNLGTAGALKAAIG